MDVIILMLSKDPSNNYKSKKNKNKPCAVYYCYGVTKKLQNQSAKYNTHCDSKITETKTT
jgi:hypothetical protein